MRDEIDRLNYKCKPLEMQKYKDFVEKYALRRENEESEETQNGSIPSDL